MDDVMVNAIAVDAIMVDGKRQEAGWKGSMPQQRFDSLFSVGAVRLDEEVLEAQPLKPIVKRLGIGGPEGPELQE